MRSASATIFAGSAKPSMWLTLMLSEYPPSRAVTGWPSVFPITSQMAMSTADLAVGLPTVLSMTA
ncbi:hypothetical protein AHiyo6_35920 [Arthrobacter sp. Hiyo6]|nr:hypothetical protein AHiyo6_35920 [Arthrobacter sp. Hiyo6]